MDQEMTALAASAATTLIAAMTTEIWEQAKNTIGGVWRRHHPAQAPAIESALESSHTELISSDGGDRRIGTVEGRWQGRFETLLEDYPQAAADLETILRQIQDLTAASASVQVTQHVNAGRDAIVAARDQTVNLRNEATGS